MQIVIEIPDDYVKVVMANQRTEGTAMDKLLRQAVIDGVQLPKGHGNIYDENDIKKEIKNPYQCQTVLYGLELVKPIIEADKAESEEV